MSCKLFWQIVRRTYPWLPLVITLCRAACSRGNNRLRAQIRFWKLYSQINFANLLAIAIDLTQPEFWV